MGGDERAGALWYSKAVSKITDALAAQLDDNIIENFADIYLVEDALKKIERKHALDDPEVIAGLATCAVGVVDSLDLSPDRINRGARQGIAARDGRDRPRARDAVAVTSRGWDELSPSVRRDGTAHPPR